MCGRFGINKQQQELEAYFNASFYSDEVRERYDPNYDVRPSTDVLVITSEMPQNIQMAHWGFKGKVFNPKTKNTTEKLFINARGETVDEKRNFKGPWQNGQRCFFIMDRFYEWMATSAGGVYQKPSICKNWEKKYKVLFSEFNVLEFQAKAFKTKKSGNFSVLIHPPFN